MKNIRIAIIGGGLAGFACGIDLINNGFKNVEIFERDENFDVRRQGYGLTILQGITALKKLGSDVFMQVYELDTPSRSHYIFECDGTIVGFYGTIFWQESSSSTSSNEKPSNKKHNLHISRQNLRKILKDKYEKVNNGRINWKKRCSKINLIEDGKEHRSVEITFDDSTRHVADLVIGCDGINSKVRRVKYSEHIDYPLNYLGIIVVLGITYSEHALAIGRVFQTVDGETRLFAMPFANLSGEKLNIMWQLSFPLSEERAKKLSENVHLLKEEVILRCGQWHEPIPSMIQSTCLEFLMGIVAYDRDPVIPSGAEDVPLVLLGDAAHPMSPFKGQGANQALLDAVSFTSFLCKEDSSILNAIKVYETEMIKRVKDKVILSRERAKTYHVPNIVNVDNFIDRGVHEELINALKMKCIKSASGDQIEQLIIDTMKQLNMREIKE